MNAHFFTFVNQCDWADVFIAFAHVTDNNTIDLLLEVQGKRIYGHSRLIQRLSPGCKDSLSSCFSSSDSTHMAVVVDSVETML